MPKAVMPTRYTAMTMASIGEMAMQLGLNLHFQGQGFFRGKMQSFYRILERKDVVDQRVYVDAAGCYQADCFINRVTVAHRSAEVNFADHELVHGDRNVASTDGTNLHDGAAGAHQIEGRSQGGGRTRCFEDHVEAKASQLTHLIVQITR